MSVLTADGLVCPGFGKNIMSVTGFTDNGAVFTISGKKAKLEFKGLMIDLRKEEDGMFYVDGTVVNTVINKRPEVYNLTTEARISPAMILDDEESDKDKNTGTDTELSGATENATQNAT